MFTLVHSKSQLSASILYFNTVTIYLIILKKLIIIQEIKENLNKTEEEKNIQLLPPRLSAVLMHVNNQNRLRSLTGQAGGRQTTGVNRENKIAPIFKYDMAPDLSYGRALPQPRQANQPSPTSPQPASIR